MPAKRSLLILLTVTALLSIVVALRVQVTYPMLGYFSDAVEWARSGHIVDSFTPLAYPLFIGPAYHLAGVRGVVGLQVLLQIAIAGVCYLVLRTLRLPRSWSAYGSLPVALYPELILSVPKVWDLGLSTFLLLLFVLVCLRMAGDARPLSLRLTAAAGLVFAAAIFCRPNLALLLPVVLVLVWRRRAELSAAGLGVRVAAFAILAVAGFCLLGVASHGAAVLPRNGPYNLHAGHNPESMAALLHDLNAENSNGTDFTDTHPGMPMPDPYSPALSSYYTQQSILFARQHPGGEVKLFFVKLFTLFRPDTKLHPLLSAGGLFKAILALPVLLFLAVLLLPGRPALSFQDWLLIAIEVLYVLPFLITNSDPRFRVPLDAILLLHMVSLIYRRRSGVLPVRSDSVLID